MFPDQDLGRQVQLAYDLYGQQTTMTTFRTGSAWNGESWPDPAPAGDTTTWTYDEATGLLTAKTDAANQSVTYTYTVDGNLASRTWARGGVTNYTYTAFGELASVSYNDNNVTPGITYTYNRTGNLAQVADAAGTRTFSYSSELDLTSESISGIYNKTINRGYTASGMIGRPLSVIFLTARQGLHDERERHGSFFSMQGVVAEILHFCLTFRGFQRYDGMMTCDFRFCFNLRMDVL